MLLWIWDRNSSAGSVLGSLSCLMQRRGFDPHLRRVSFSCLFVCLGVFLINRGLAFARVHSIARTQKKILTFMYWTDKCRRQNTPSLHFPRRRDVTASMVRLKSGHKRKSLTQSGEPRDVAGERRRRRSPWRNRALYDTFPSCREFPGA